MAELVPSSDKEPTNLSSATSDEPLTHPTTAATAEVNNPCRFFQEGRCHFGTRCRNYHAGDASDAHHLEDSIPPHSPAPQLQSGKKPAMKTADDVISRILWDEQVPTECFSIGYLDRFLGIVEEPFSAFSWEDLASAGPGVLAIPKHRIQYFKYKTRVVWDKVSRTDDIFGSTGSGITILEVIKEEKEAAKAVEEKVHNHSSNGDGEIVMGAEGGGMADHTEEEENRGKWVEMGTDRPEMVKEFEEAVGNLNPDDITHLILDDLTQEAKASVLAIQEGDMSKHAYGITDGNSLTMEDEENVVSNSRDDKSFPLSKQRPTHFIAIRITSPEIREAAKRFQEALCDIRPDLAEFCTTLSTLHLTLCLLHLESPEEILKAITVLQELQANSQRLLPPALLLSFQGVDTFNARVLYIAPISALELESLARTLEDTFKEKGLVVIHPPYREKFHLTIVKIPAKKGRPKLPAHSSWVPHIKDIGTQAVEALYLCETGQGRRTDGFYTTLLKLDLY
ncbi:leukocyte receptor cluster member 9 [Tiliqua scincoides]|uniref:leukocyte receptor cluster member 9 n=1 Tax=Tiliqua scincoides TaxID=71010 RepID=UPI00346219AA